MATTGCKTDTMEDYILQAVFYNSALPSFANMYIALCTSSTAVSDTVVGTPPSYAQYARVSMPRNSSYWTLNPPFLDRGMYNATKVTFPAPATASGEILRYFEIWTAATGGTRLYWGQLDADVSTYAGFNPEFPIRALSIQEY